MESFAHNGNKMFYSIAVVEQRNREDKVVKGRGKTRGRTNDAKRK